MALNALQADMVRFTGTPGVEVNGIIVGYRAEYTPRTSTDPKYDRLIDNKHSSNIDYSGQYYVQLGEELYNGDLTKKHVTDDFERPSYNWQYKGKEIGTYVDYTVLVNGGTFTEAVKYSELYELLTYTSINDNDISRFVDGVEDTTLTKSKFARSNKDEVGGQGVLTEVFLDRDRKQITITSINTYLAQANSDYNKTNETLSLKVYNGIVAGTHGTSATSVTKIVDSKDVPQAADVAKDDFRLVYMSGKENPANFDVVKMFNVDVMAESSVTKWSKSSTKVIDKLTTGGTEYKSNDKAFYDDGNVFDDYNNQLLTDNKYNIYMDRYGNVIGVDLFEGTKNYVFITGYDRRGSNISVNTATAAGIFTDGTMDTITVNVTDTNKNIDRYNSNHSFSQAKGNINNSYYQDWTYGTTDGDRSLNRWYTYTVSNSGVYTLKPVERSFYTAYDLDTADPAKADEKILDIANLYVDDSRIESYNDADAVDVQQARAYGNDDSIYITVSGDAVDTSDNALDAITDVDGVYTGAQNVKLELTPGHKGVINTTTGKASESNAYVYTVYDSKYYIVASIVIGEAQGAAANYAYILGDAKNERIEREGDARANGDVTYYWEFDAVVNGEKTTLTAKSKYTDVFSTADVVKYTVRELRFDGEYVVGVKAPKADDYHIWNNSEVGIDKKDVYDVGNVVGLDAWGKSGVMDSPKSDVAATNARVSGTIEQVGRTLYVNPGPTRGVGLALASDAKAVLIQPENGKREVTNCGSVSEALGRLADRGTYTAEYPAGDPAGIQFQGRIAAVLKNGQAQWVVIISDTNLVTGNNPNYNQSSSVTFGNIRIEVYGMGTQNVTGYINADGDLNIVLPTTPTLVRAIPDNYDVDVYVNGALIGTILTPSAQSTDGKTVTYTLTGAKLTATNMQIVARVYPEGSTDPKPPVVDPTKPVSAVTMTKVPADSVKVGDALTATTSTAGVTVKVDPAKADKAGDLKVVITLTTSNEKGFDEKVTVDGATDWTVASVTGNKNAITLTKTIKVTDDGNTPAPTDGSVVAKFNSDHYDLYAYGSSVTVEQAESAILAAYNVGKSGDAVATSVEIDGTTVTITTKGGTTVTSAILGGIKSGALAEPKPLYSVKVNGTHKTYWDGSAALTTGLEGAGNKIAEAKIAVLKSGATNYVTATDALGAVSLPNGDVTNLVKTGTKDINLVDYVEVSFAQNADVKFNYSETGEIDPTGSNVSYYIVKGTQLTAKNAGSVAAGASVYFAVDGTTTEIKNSGTGAAAAGTLKSAAFSVNAPKTGTVLNITKPTVFPVTVDGNPAETFDGEAATKSSTIKVNSKYVMLSSGESGVAGASDAVSGLAATKSWFEATKREDGYWLDLSDTSKVDSTTLSGWSSLSLVKAYMVEAASSGDWTAGTNPDGTAIANGAKKLLVKAGEDGKFNMYVKTTANGTATLQAASGSKVTLGTLTRVAGTSLPNASTGAAATTGLIYACEITGDVKATDIVVKTEIELEATQEGATVNAATNTVTYSAAVGDGDDVVIKFKSTGLAGKTFSLAFVKDTGVTAGIKDDATTVTVGSDGTFSVTIHMTTAGTSGDATKFGKLVLIETPASNEIVGTVVTLVNGT